MALKRAVEISQGRGLFGIPCHKGLIATFQASLAWATVSSSLLQVEESACGAYSRHLAETPSLTSKRDIEARWSSLTVEPRFVMSRRRLIILCLDILRVRRLPAPHACGPLSLRRPPPVRHQPRHLLPMRSPRRAVRLRSPNQPFPHCSLLGGRPIASRKVIPVRRDQLSQFVLASPCVCFSSSPLI